MWLKVAHGRSLLAGELAGLLVACGSDDSSPVTPIADASHDTPPGDAPPGDAPSSDSGETEAATPDGGAECTSLEFGGQVVQGMFVVGVPPVPQGGTIADGTYDLVEYRAYVATLPVGMTSPGTFGITWRVSEAATQLEWFESHFSPPESQFRLRGDFVVWEDRNELFFRQTCPEASPGGAPTLTMPYSSTAGDLSITYGQNVLVLRRR